MGINFPFQPHMQQINIFKDCNRNIKCAWTMCGGDEIKNNKKR
jgi:hypothetical protein